MRSTTSRSVTILLTVGLLLVGLVGCQSEAPMVVMDETAEAMPEPVELPVPLMATASLQAAEGGEVTGNLMFTEGEEGVTIVAEVSGASPGLHGFHLHETGDCSAADFTSAGGHFNPYGTPHAGPADAERHGGDLGNIEIGEDGSGRLELVSDLVTVGEGPASVVGRAVVFHAGEDDLASQPAGAAGPRLACGVIALVVAAEDDEEGTEESMSPATADDAADEEADPEVEPEGEG